MTIHRQSIVDLGKGPIKSVLSVVTPLLLRNKPIREWPGWLGRVDDVKVPRALPAKEELSPTGAANINILTSLIEATRHLEGDIADCGVYRAASTVGTGYIFVSEESQRLSMRSIPLKDLTRRHFIPICPSGE